MSINTVTKKLATVLTLTAFIAIAVFGVVLMDHAMMSPSDCAASVMNGGPCPTSQIQIFIHHFSSIKIFSAVVVPPALTLLILISLLLTAVSLFLFGKGPQSPPFLFSSNRSGQTKNNLYTRKLLRFLSLFENSPSF